MTCGLPLQHVLPQSNHEKTIRLIPTEGHSTSSVTLKTVKIIRKKTQTRKQSLRNHDSQEEPEMWCSGYDPGTVRGHEEKQGNLN